MYGRLMDKLREAGHGDGPHAASWVAIELQAAAAFMLILVLAARLVHPVLAIPALLAGMLILSGRQLTPLVIGENDMRFQTLLFYFITTFAALFVVVGWSLWT